MNFDTVAYAVNFISTQYNAISGQDFTLDALGENIVAWNPAKGTAPTPDQIQAGVLLKIKADLVSRINQFAGEIRNSYLSDGMYITEEYHLAETEAKDYASRSFADPVPQTVKDYADILGTTNYQAVATGILTTSGQMKAILTYVRKIRLGTNAAIKTAVDSTQASTIYTAGITQLTSLRAP